MTTGWRTMTTAIFFLALTATVASCAWGRQIVTKAADPAEIKGTYTLLLYGCHYPDQLQNIAFLVADGAKYPLEIYDLKTSYKVKKGLSASQALTEADTFVRCSSHRVWQTQVRGIPDDGGGVIGYEVRPLYFPLEYGQADVILTSYSLKDGMIKAYIRLDEDVRRMQESLGDKDSSMHP